VLPCWPFGWCDRLELRFTPPSHAAEGHGDSHGHEEGEEKHDEGKEEQHGHGHEDEHGHGGGKEEGEHAEGCNPLKCRTDRGSGH
jgi:hypothetical protein